MRAMLGLAVGHVSRESLAGGCWDCKERLVWIEAEALGPDEVPWGREGGWGTYSAQGFALQRAGGRGTGICGEGDGD